MRATKALRRTPLARQDGADKPPGILKGLGGAAKDEHRTVLDTLVTEAHEEGVRLTPKALLKGLVNVHVHTRQHIHKLLRAQRNLPTFFTAPAIVLHPDTSVPDPASTSTSTFTFTSTSTSTSSSSSPPPAPEGTRAYFEKAQRRVEAQRTYARNVVSGAQTLCGDVVVAVVDVVQAGFRPSDLNSLTFAKDRTAVPGLLTARTVRAATTKEEIDTTQPNHPLAATWVEEDDLARVLRHTLRDMPPLAVRLDATPLHMAPATPAAPRTTDEDRAFVQCGTATVPVLDPAVQLSLHSFYHSKTHPLLDKRTPHLVRLYHATRNQAIARSIL